MLIVSLRSFSCSKVSTSSSVTGFLPFFVFGAGAAFDCLGADLDDEATGGVGFSRFSFFSLYFSFPFRLSDARLFFMFAI